MSYEVTVYKRADLYAEVWAKPIREVSKKYGVSDVALRKICKRLDVPTPDNSYWGKKRAGRTVAPIPLPALKPGAAEEHRVQKWRPPPPPPPTPADLAVRRVYEANYQRLIAPFTVEVKATLHGAHPLVARSRAALRKADPKYNRGLLYSPDAALPVRVGPLVLDRAMRIVDAVLKAVERAGHQVKDGHLRGSKEVWLVISGEDVEFHVSERLKRVPYVAKKGDFDWGRKWDDVPSGDLRLTIQWDREWRRKREWQDAPDRPLEEQVNDVFLGILQAAADRKADVAARAERSRLEAEEARRRAEIEAARREEARKDDLVRQSAARWIEAENVRAFVVSVGREAERRFGKNSPELLQGWIARATRVANELDPTPQLLAAFERSLASASASPSDPDG